MKKIKVCSGFAGYGGAEFGLEKAGISYEVVGYMEINKYAIQCYEQNHPNIKNYGDISKVNPDDLPDFDLFTGGFPCQDVSIAGNRDLSKGRTMLFDEIIRICEVKKPSYIFLENVKGLLSMTKFWQYVKSELSRIGYSIRYKVLNSKDFGIPQNRERIWILCQLEQFVPFVEIFPRPEKLKLTVKDLLEKDVDKKYFLSDAGIKRLEGGYYRQGTDNKINQCLTSSDLVKQGRDCPIVADFRNDEGLRIRKDNISPCLNARAREDLFGMPIVHSLQPRSIDRPCMQKAIKEGKALPGGYGPLSRDDGLSYCVDTGNTQAVEYDKVWRRFTPLECFRLMGFGDGEINIDGISDSQCYKLAGNGWDVNLVSKIFKTWLGQNEKI